MKNAELSVSMNCKKEWISKVEKRKKGTKVEKR